MEENKRVEEAEGGCANHYQRLVKQTCEFMLSNPSFCAVIELCAQQVGKANRRRKADVTLEKKLYAEFEDKFKTLDGSKLTKREYMAGATDIIVDMMMENSKGNPLDSVIAYSFAITTYYKNTFDIHKTIKDYSEKNIKAQQEYREVFTKKTDFVPRDEGAKRAWLLLNVALENYELAIKIAKTIGENYNDRSIETTISLMIIKIAYYGHENRVDKMVGSYDAFRRISEIVKPGGVNVNLFLALLLANRNDDVSDEVINKFCDYVIVNNPEASLVFKLWPCFQKPDSEPALKLLAEPTVAKVVTELLGVVTAITEQKNVSSDNCYGV